MNGLDVACNGDFDKQAKRDRRHSFAQNCNMYRAMSITARRLLSIAGVIVASVIANPVNALSSEEWVVAFVRFVEWPTPLADNALIICQPPDTPPLDLDGKQVRGVTLQVVRVANVRELDRCQLFAALSGKETGWSPWINAIKSRPILAVGIGARFCEIGGTICLVKDEASGAEKYQLNLDTLSRAGFKVSSQLLRSQPQRTARGE